LKILLISQVFYPDTVSVSQHLTDLSISLAEKGHDISVFTSKYPYESKNNKFSTYESYRKIKIFRVNQSGFGKGKTVYRLIDFFTFYISIFFKLLTIKSGQFDIIVGTSVPPMLAVVGVFISKIKNIKFYYWVMDLQPELSISSGLIKKKSILAKVLTFFGNYSIRNSKKIFSLDSYMSKHLIKRGAIKNQVYTSPPWPVLNKIFLGSHDDNPFRIKYKFENKTVIMYSGNHAFVHPLDTILDAARILRDNTNFLFVFIGDGVRKSDVKNYKDKYNLKNIIQLPFQPRENIHFSLGSSDLQVVIMGKNQIGFTHPNKIYGGMFIGKPIIYIGPDESHVTDILQKVDGNILVNHTESKKLANNILDFYNLSSVAKKIIGDKNRMFANLNYNPEKLKSEMCNQITVDD
jgi:colanic acid biosynthesis glycosyl transferase WcaI